MYKIIFEDTTTFEGGEPQNSLWNEMPQQSIKSIEYDLLGVKTLLKDFEAYNHIVEKVQFINPKGNQASMITRVIVMGKWKEKVYETIYDLNKNIISKSVADFGKEYESKGRRVPVTGWKLGNINLKATPKMIKI